MRFISCSMFQKANSTTCLPVQRWKKYKKGLTTSFFNGMQEKRREGGLNAGSLLWKSDVKTN